MAQTQPYMAPVLGNSTAIAFGYQCLEWTKVDCALFGLGCLGAVGVCNCSLYITLSSH